MSNKIIIDYNECSSHSHETLNIYKHKGKYLLFIKDLSDDSAEMRYCDEKGRVEENSPVVIAKIFETQKDTDCVRYV